MEFYAKIRRVDRRPAQPTNPKIQEAGSGTAGGVSGNGPGVGSGVGPGVGSGVGPGVEPPRVIRDHVVARSTPAGHVQVLRGLRSPGEGRT